MFGFWEGDGARACVEFGNGRVVPPGLCVSSWSYPALKRWAKLGCPSGASVPVALWNVASGIRSRRRFGGRYREPARQSLLELRSAVAMGLQFRRRYDIAFGVATGFRSGIHVDIEWGMALWAVGSINTEVVGVQFGLGARNGVLETPAGRRLETSAARDGESKRG
jgi:hypothetical protein